MKLTKTEIERLVEEVVAESHTKEQEEELKVIVGELEKASEMHASQAKRIKDIVGETDDEELEEKLHRMIKEEYQQVVTEEKSAKDRMKCNSPRRIRKGEPGHGKKKFVVKACDGGTEKIIRYGDAKMEIKKDNPARRKSFRARHKCDSPGSKLKARYWSCKKW